MSEKLNLKAEVFFLIIGLFWGIVLLIINPPFQAPDEDAHLFKMWGMLNGSFNFKVYEGYKVQKVPESVAILLSSFESMKFDLKVKTSKQDILSFKKYPLNKDKTVYYKIVPTSYTIVSYTPQIICLFVLKLLNIPPLFMIYILRFCCLLYYLSLIYFAIKLTPYKKWLFAILGLLPTNLYIAGAISTDCLVIGSSFLFIAYTLYLKFDDKITHFSNKQLFLWCALFTYICILKYLYFPLILIYFLLPKNKFQSSKKYYSIFLFLGTFIALYILFFLINVISLSKIGADGFDNHKTDKLELIKHILFDITGFVKIVILTTIVRIKFLFSGVISQFGWEPFFISPFISFLFYVLVFVFSFFKENNIKNLARSDKLIVLIGIIFVYTLTLTSVFILYATYPIILGWQGRYGAPYIPLLFIILTGSKISISNKSVLTFSLIVLQLLYISTTCTILQRFY